MTFSLNGSPTSDYEAPLSVAALLEELQLAGSPVLVELDGVALRPREFATRQIGDGSRVEILRVAAGG